MLSLIEAVTIGTMGFWIMISVISFFMVYFLEFRKSVLATLTFIGTLFVLYHLMGINVSWFVHHLPRVTLFAFLYTCVVGVTWAIFKWWRKVENLAQKCKEVKYEFLKNHRITDGVISPDKMEDWDNFVHSRLHLELRELKTDSTGIIPPHPNDFKEDIYLWIFFWPWSMFWFVIDEPVRKLGCSLYRRIRGSLVAISEHAFRDIKSDFAPHPPTPEDKKMGYSDRRKYY